MRAVIGVILLVLMAGVVLPMATGSLVAAECPPSEMSFGGGGPFQTAAAQFDSLAFMSGISGARVAFDIQAGWVQVYRCCGLGIGYTAMRDSFEVLGVSRGTRVDAVAEMEVTGSILSGGCSPSGCWGYLDATITSASQSTLTRFADSIYPAESHPVSGAVRFPTSFVSGELRGIEFRLSAWRAAGGNNGAQGTGRIRFLGLPPGAVVVSCNGYSSATVPVRRATWGSVKTIYR